MGLLINFFRQEETEMGEKDISAREMADAFLEEFLRDGSVVGRGVVLDRGRGESARPLTEDAYVDMAKHMKRYHPHGMTENSTCKYIDQWKVHGQAKESEPNENANSLNSMPSHYSPIYESIGVKESQEYLSDTLSIEIVRADTAKVLKDIDFATMDRAEFVEQGEPVDEATYEKAIKILYSVCKDIRDRISSEFRLAHPLFVPWDFAKIFAAGRSSPDRRITQEFQRVCKENNITDPRYLRRECYLSLGDVSNLDLSNSPNFHTKEDFRFDIMRHEIGHNLATKAIMQEWMVLKGALGIYIKQRMGVESPETIASAIQKVIAKEISIGAARNDEETVAEIFSIYTSPTYKKGTMDTKIENIAKHMLTQYSGGKVSMEFTYDEKESARSAKEAYFPFSRRMVRAMSYNNSLFPLSEAPKDAKISWLDEWDGKWHRFDTYDEMLRYVLDAYGFKEKHIGRIAQGVPNARWNSMTLWDVKKMYAWDDESVEDIVNKYKDMAGTATSPELTEEEMNEIAKEVIANMHKDKGSVAQDGAEGIGFVFDPEEFDQNSFEWGALYGINNIREAVQKMSQGTVIPDEQFLEMLAPLKMTAKVYAESHGKNKAWVKKTVLGVPKAFLNAFDVLSDGEGVSRERFLAVMTVEGICALAEGSVDSIHDIERFYDRKGEYADREGYKVGDWVVIEKNAPDKEVVHNIRRILAFSGEGKASEAIFWNGKKSGVIKRRLEDCSKPFESFDAAADYATDENWAEDEDLEYTMYLGAILQSMGLGMDAGIDPSDPDFWMKHDRARHGGHFDPETQTCSLREQMGLPTAKNKGEREAQAERKDEEDMLGGENPSVVTVGVSKNSDKGKKRERLKNIIEATGRGVDADKFISLLAAIPRESQVAAAARRLKAKGNVKPQMRKITAQDFHKVISDAVSTRPEADRWRVDVHPITDYEDMECYASDGGSVFAIHGTDIVSVCKRKGDSTCGGKDLLESAVEHGGNKLDSYEGNHAFYTRCGFEPVAWTKFNPEWAPVGALPEDIVFYKYTGNKRLLTPEEAKKDVEAFKGTMEQMKYEVAQAYRDARL